MNQRIGLLTFTSNNYGACLQAYAMRKALEALKAEVTFINYIPASENPAGSSSRKSLRTFLSYVLSRDLPARLKARPIHAARAIRFDDFRKRHILTDSHSYTSIAELESLKERLDAVVCGSDMIWSAETPHLLDTFLLTWCGDMRRISYAPSIGNTDIPDHLIAKYRTALADFNAISCREKSGSDLISSLTGRDIPTVADPTLLFDASQWSDWFPAERPTRPYILVYCFDGINSSMRRQLKAIARRHDIDIRYILSNNPRDTVRETRYGDGAYGPAEFVGLFSQAAFTVVNGYHGLLFSLIFRKPFALLHREQGTHWGIHETRMEEMTDRLGLQDRYIMPDGVITDDMLSLDYTAIADKLETLSRDSYSYLQNALSAIHG